MGLSVGLVNDGPAELAKRTSGHVGSSIQILREQSRGRGWPRDAGRAEERRDAVDGTRGVLLKARGHHDAEYGRGVLRRQGGEVTERWVKCHCM